MINSFNLFCQLAIIIALFRLLIQRTHFLMALLSLEGVILSLVLFVPIILCFSGNMIPSVRIVLLTFGVCEASLGLRLMVFMSRSYGSDYIRSVSINKC